MRLAIKIGSGWVGPHFFPISVELPQSNIPKKNNAKTMGEKNIEATAASVTLAQIILQIHGIRGLFNTTEHWKQYVNE